MEQYRSSLFLKVFMHERKLVGDKGGCLFASLGHSFENWSAEAFLEEREAGSNLSRWQRKQVI